MQGGWGQLGLQDPQVLGGEEFTWAGRKQDRSWQRGHGDKVTRMRNWLQHVKNDKQFGVAGA